MRFMAGGLEYLTNEDAGKERGFRLGGSLVEGFLTVVADTKRFHVCFSLMVCIWN